VGALGQLQVLIIKLLGPSNCTLVPKPFTYYHGPLCDEDAFKQLL